MVRRCWVNFQCRGVLLIWIIVGQGPIALAVGAGGGCLDIFSLIYHKGPFSPKQPTNHLDCSGTDKSNASVLEYHALNRISKFSTDSKRRSFMCKIGLGSRNISNIRLFFFDNFYGAGGGRVVRWCWVNFQCRGVLLVWMIVGQGPIALAVDAGGGCLDIFSLVCHFSFLSPSLWETARYRLKYCL